MILYSIIPANVVFDNSYGKSEETKFKEMAYMGEMVQVSPLTNNRFVIQRVISTNPIAYLNPKLQPGTIIEPLV